MRSEASASHAPVDVECAEDATPSSVIRRRPTTRSLAFAPGTDRGTRPMKIEKNNFTETKWALVLEAGDGSPEALQELCQAYYAPLQAFARRIVFDPRRAEDVLQGFLTTRVLEEKLVRKADPSRGRLRAFLCTALFNYASNLRRAEKAQKRGGGAGFVELDFDDLASETPTTSMLFDRACARDWVRTVVDRAVARLREEQRAGADEGAAFDVLWKRLIGDDYDEEPLREAGVKLGETVVNVRQKLFRLRGRYHCLVRAEIATTVANAEDVDAEVEELLAAMRRDQ